MSRYFRCQSDACRRKWHTSSIARLSAPKVFIRGDLLDLPEPPPLEPVAWCCPSCGGDLEPEAGTFEELFTAPANLDSPFGHGRPNL